MLRRLVTVATVLACAAAPAGARAATVSAADGVATVAGDNARDVLTLEGLAVVGATVRDDSGLTVGDGCTATSRTTALCCAATRA